MAYFFFLLIIFIISEIVLALLHENITLPDLLPRNCGEAIPPWDLTTEGIFDLEVQGHKFSVRCVQDPEKGPAWTLIQRRMNGAVDFNRTWDDYESGFGTVDSEFWLGLKYIYALTNATRNELWIKLDDYENATKSAKYDEFAIDDAKHKYTVKFGKYSGKAGDSLKKHNGKKFSTYDRDYDNYVRNCAEDFGGGWWYTLCFDGFLNAIYKQYEERNTPGITWKTWHEWQYSYKYVHMAVRPFYYSLELLEMPTNTWLERAHYSNKK